MKRNRPLRRHAWLRTNTQLRAKTQPKRFGITPGSSSVQPKRSTGLQPKPAPMTPEEKHGKKVVRARSLVGEVRMCEICGTARATDWHHRVNRSQGGTWDPANGLDLCRRDHARVTDTRSEFYGNGWLVKPWDDPLTRPVLYRGRWVLLNNHGHVTPTSKGEKAA